MRRAGIATAVAAVLLGHSHTVGAQAVGSQPSQQTVELDNTEVRAHRLVLGEGAALAVEGLESVAVFVRGDRVRISPESDVISTAWRPGGAAIVRAGRHDVANIGRGSVELVWVELKKSGSRSYRGMPRDPIAVDPARHSLVVENADVRVLRQISEVGKTGPSHDHPSYMTVRISGVANGDRGPGNITWTDGPFTHGGTPAAQALNVIIIEPKSGVGAKAPNRADDTPR
jgi:hypothetical protein